VRSLRERFAEDEFCRFVRQEKGAPVDISEPSVEMLRISVGDG